MCASVISKDTMATKLLECLKCKHSALIRQVYTNPDILIQMYLIDLLKSFLFYFSHIYFKKGMEILWRPLSIHHTISS